MKMRSRLFCILLLSLLLSDCFTVRYDFKGGATIDPKIKTLSVQFFNNRSTSFVNPTISQTFTEGLKSYMENNTNLRLVNTIGNVDFSGEINRYDYVSTGVVAGDVAAKTRFTISIRVKFANSIDPKNNFDQNFSAFRDFDSKTSFTSVENELSKEIIDEIIEQIFNKAFVNW
jgi:hypothetical protein